MGDEKIIIPMNEAGERCFDVFVSLAYKMLYRARDAVEEIIGEEAEMIAEKAMVNGKYFAIYMLPNGSTKTAVYDYRTKALKIVSEQTIKTKGVKINERKSERRV